MRIWYHHSISFYADDLRKSAEIHGASDSIIRNLSTETEEQWQEYQGVIAGKIQAGLIKLPVNVQITIPTGEHFRLQYKFDQSLLIILSLMFILAGWLFGALRPNSISLTVSAAGVCFYLLSLLTVNSKVQRLIEDAAKDVLPIAEKSSPDMAVFDNTALRCPSCGGFIESDDTQCPACKAPVNQKHEETNWNASQHSIHQHHYIFRPKPQTGSKNEALP